MEFYHVGQFHHNRPAGLKKTVFYSVIIILTASFMVCGQSHFTAQYLIESFLTSNQLTTDFPSWLALLLPLYRFNRVQVVHYVFPYSTPPSSTQLSGMQRTHIYIIPISEALIDRKQSAFPGICCCCSPHTTGESFHFVCQ